MCKRYYIAILITIMACFGFLLLQFSYNNNQALTNNKSESHYNIQIITKSPAKVCCFWNVVGEGIKAAAEEFNVNCEVTAPPNENSIDAQIELVKRAIAKKPDAIILAATDYEKLVPICKEVDKEGILLLTLDSNVNFDKVRCFVGTDNYEMGKKLSLLINSVIGPNDKFGVIGYIKTTSTGIEREKGLLDNIENADERMSAIAYCNGSVLLAEQLTTQMIRNNPQITCIVGLNEISSLGAAYAIEKVRKERSIKLIASDSSQGQIKFMESGIIQASVIQNPFNMGYLGVKNTIKILNGETVPYTVYTDSLIIKKEDLYKAENQKLLFPFTEV